MSQWGIWCGPCDLFRGDMAQTKCHHFLGDHCDPVSPVWTPAFHLCHPWGSVPALGAPLHPLLSASSVRSQGAQPAECPSVLHAGGSLGTQPPTMMGRCLSCLGSPQARDKAII